VSVASVSQTFLVKGDGCTKDVPFVPSHALLLYTGHAGQSTLRTVREGERIFPFEGALMGLRMGAGVSVECAAPNRRCGFSNSEGAALATSTKGQHRSASKREEAMDRLAARAGRLARQS